MKITAAVVGLLLSVTTLGVPAANAGSGGLAGGLPHVVVIGDSITGGGGTANPDKYAWPTQLGYDRVSTNGGCLVTPGCFGGKSPAVDTYDTEVLGKAPDVVVIAMGINDITAEDVRMVDILAAMEAMAAKNQALGIDTYVGTVTPVRGVRFKWFDHNRRRLNNMIRDRFGSHVIDFDTALVAKSGRLRKRYDCGDKLHLNAAAYKAMAKIAAGVLRQPL